MSITDTHGMSSAEHPSTARSAAAAEPASTGKDPAPAVTRALRVLTLLEQAGGSLTLSDIARGLGAAKSSTSNVCGALEAGGMVQRTEGGYRLGLRTAELGGSFIAGFNQVREFFTVVESVPELRGEVVQIVMRDGRDALYLARHEGRQNRVGTPIGSRLPLVYSATGIAILATLEDAEVDALLAAETFVPNTERSAQGADQVRAKIAEARERGWGLDRGEAYSGIAGVAAPLAPWRPSDPQMAIGVAFPVEEMDEGTIERLGAGVLAATRQLTNPFERAVRGNGSAPA
jgi:DNA-binding IclR family transcriptional regulator